MTHDLRNIHHVRLDDNCLERYHLLLRFKQNGLFKWVMLSEQVDRTERLRGAAYWILPKEFDR